MHRTNFTSALLFTSDNRDDLVSSRWKGTMPMILENHPKPQHCKKKCDLCSFVNNPLNFNMPLSEKFHSEYHWKKSQHLNHKVQINILASLNEHLDNTKIL